MMVALAVATFGLAQDLTDVYLAQFNQQLMANAQMMQNFFANAQFNQQRYLQQCAANQKVAAEIREIFDYLLTEEKQSAYLNWRRRLAVFSMRPDNGEAFLRECTLYADTMSRHREEIGMDCGTFVDALESRMCTACQQVQSATRQLQQQGMQQMQTITDDVRKNTPYVFQERRCQFCGETYSGTMKCPCRTIPKYSDTYRNRVIIDTRTDKVIDVIY